MAKTVTWNYQGIDNTTGQSVSGAVQANTAEEAADNASAEGVTPISVSRASTAGTWLTSDMRVRASKREVAMFIRGYSTAASSTCARRTL